MKVVTVFWRLLLAAAVLVLAGCTFNRAVHETQGVLEDLRIIDRTQVAGGRDWVVPRHLAWLVGLSSKGVDPEVDARVARALASALRQEFATVYLAPAPADLQKNLQLARQMGAQALVQADLLRFGDGTYSWAEWLENDEDQAAGRAQMTVALVVYDAQSGRVVDSLRIEGKEGWWPAVTEQRDALMEQAFSQFATRISYKDAERPR